MANLAAVKRMKEERVVQVVDRLAKVQGLRDVCVVEIEEGIVVQGLAHRSKRNVDYFVYKTQLLSHKQLEKLAHGL